MKEVKSFTFKVAKATESKKQLKAREGVAIAGCSYAAPWILRYGGAAGRDTGAYC